MHAHGQVAQSPIALENRARWRRRLMEAGHLDLALLAMKGELSPFQAGLAAGDSHDKCSVVAWRRFQAALLAYHSANPKRAGRFMRLFQPLLRVKIKVPGFTASAFSASIKVRRPPRGAIKKR